MESRLTISSTIHDMNSNSWYNDFFFPRDAMHSAVLTQYNSVCLPVCLSVTQFSYRYRAHIGWNSLKIISRPNSVRLMRWLTPNIDDLVHREHSKITVE